jgi:hypothetical protein
MRDQVNHLGTNGERAQFVMEKVLEKGQINGGVSPIDQQHPVCSLLFPRLRQTKFQRKIIITLKKKPTIL